MAVSAVALPSLTRPRTMPRKHSGRSEIARANVPASLVGGVAAAALVGHVYDEPLEDEVVGDRVQADEAPGQHPLHHVKFDGVHLPGDAHDAVEVPPGERLAPLAHAHPGD